MTSSNEVLEAGHRIQVAVRVRPVLPHEASEPIAVTCSTDGSKVQVAMPERESSKPAIAASARPDAKAYAFDACLAGSITQDQLFNICGLDELVEAAVDGYCCTVFAFGQTGSGKTYSIIGPGVAGLQEAAWSAPGSRPARQTPQPPADAAPYSGDEGPAAPNCDAASEDNEKQQQQTSDSGSLRPASSNNCSKDAQQVQLREEDGLLARCVAQLYNSISQRQGDLSCKVIASVCEIYNEAVADLLARNKNQQLQVRQDSNEAFYVEGLTQKEAESPHKALMLMADALNYRHTRAHQLNSYSSRSHCLITFTIASEELGAQQGTRGGVRRAGKLVLVDLAGSERLKDTGSNAKEAVRETGAINKSLFTLGQVLAALSVRGGCGVTGHVPYRDSRLTQLLWDGLRGGGRALMLACLSPLKAHAEESLNTLHFASMALRIKSQPIIIMDPQDQMVLEMRDLIKALQEDCRSLAGAIAQISVPGTDVPAVLQQLPPTLVQDALRYGSSSAPTLEHNGHRLSSLRAPGGRTRTSSGNRAKAACNMKPLTADATMRHSLPALLSYSPGSSPSPKKQQRGSKPRQQTPLWNSSPALQSQNSRFGNSAYNPFLPQQPMNSLTADTGRKSSGRSGFPAYVVPPHTGGHSIFDAQRASYEAVRSSGSLPGRIGQACYASNSSSSTSPWLGNSKFPGIPGRAAAAGISSSYVDAGGVGTGSLGRQFAAVEAGAGRIPTKHDIGMSPDAFPELAALEQQFQQQLTCGIVGTGAAATDATASGYISHQLQSLPAAVEVLGSTGLQDAVQYNGTGSSGMLVPSGLPASIHQPRTLVPVRNSVADTETVGTNPGASPVVVAIAAAETHVRPLAVPLRPSAVGADGRSTHGSSVGYPTPRSGVEGDTAAGAAEAVPEPKALSWAERNSWFGSDAQMTQLAYQVHDKLVEQGVDPASDVYYTAIETQVAASFPDKWAQHLAIQAAMGSRGKQARTSGPQYGSPAAYTSYRMSLKPSVAAIRGSGTANNNKATSSWQLQHDSRNRSPARQQQQWQQQYAGSQAISASQGQLPGRAFAEEMLKLYQQHGSAGVISSSCCTIQGQQQQHPSASSPQPTTPTDAAACLPELQVSNSPVAETGNITSSQSLQRATAAVGDDSVSNISPAASSPMLTAEPAAAVALGVRNSQSLGLGMLQSSTQPAPLNLPVANRLPGGVSAAAGQLLASNAASYYNGAGPLTGTAKQSWSLGKYGQHMEAGKCLAEVLRAGVSPGNKSLAELQADYRAARALVLDQLRRQKEEAETQRKQILMQIGRAINSSKWRT